MLRPSAAGDAVFVMEVTKIKACTEDELARVQKMVKHAASAAGVQMLDAPATAPGDGGGAADEEVADVSDGTDHDTLSAVEKRVLEQTADASASGLVV